MNRCSFWKNRPLLCIPSQTGDKFMFPLLQAFDPVKLYTIRPKCTLTAWSSEQYFTNLSRINRRSLWETDKTIRPVASPTTGRTNDWTSALRVKAVRRFEATMPGSETFKRSSDICLLTPVAHRGVRFMAETQASLRGHVCFITPKVAIQLWKSQEKPKLSREENTLI